MSADKKITTFALTLRDGETTLYTLLHIKVKKEFNLFSPIWHSGAGHDGDDLPRFLFGK